MIQLDVTQGNEAATQLYESFGFQAFGLEPMALRAASGYLSKLHMWLHLANGENAAEKTGP